MTFSSNHIIRVKEKLPDFWNLSTKVASDLRTGKIANNDKLLEQIRLLLDPDFVKKIDNVISGWKTIATLHNGETALHTLIVFATCLNLPEYKIANSQTCFEIEWSIILHDIDKKMARQDTAHPFRSAALASRIMANLGFELLPKITEDDVEAWAKLVLSAQRQDGERMLHDHSFLREIINGIYKCWGYDTSATRILKAVLFHQSLPTVQEWTNAVLLTDKELSFALTLNDMRVIAPLIIADSDSWNIFSHNRSSNLSELRINNKKTCVRIQNAIKQSENAP